METYRRTADELLDVVRVLLLLQGAILVTTTLEALIVGAALTRSGGPVVMSGAAAAVILAARARLRADRGWSRRLVYGVEGFTVAAVVVDIALAIALAGALPPLVALLTQLLLPLSVIVLLRRSARGTSAPTPPSTVASLGGRS